MDKNMDKNMNSNEKNEKIDKPKKKKLKCEECKTKLGMIYFTCKCGKIFCSKHLNPHSHNCMYDYKGARQKELSKNNPKLENNTLIKI